MFRLLFKTIFANPFSSTVTTCSLLLCQVISDVSTPSAASTESRNVSSCFPITYSLFNLIPCSSFFFITTVQSADLFPNVAVTTTVPSLIGVTRPVSSTVAISLLLLFQETEFHGIASNSSCSVSFGELSSA